MRPLVIGFVRASCPNHRTNLVTLWTMRLLRSRSSIHFSAPKLHGSCASHRRGALFLDTTPHQSGAPPWGAGFGPQCQLHVGGCLSGSPSGNTIAHPGFQKP